MWPIRSATGGIHSGQINDDGIDEASLRHLADKTGGKYYPVRNAATLSRILEELTWELGGSTANLLG